MSHNIACASLGGTELVEKGVKCPTAMYQRDTLADKPHKIRRKSFESQIEHKIVVRHAKLTHSSVYQKG